jgi:hypothetical protein
LRRVSFFTRVVRIDAMEAEFVNEVQKLRGKSIVISILWAGYLVLLVFLSLALAYLLRRTITRYRSATGIGSRVSRDFMGSKRGEYNGR